MVTFECSKIAKLFDCVVRRSGVFARLRELDMERLSYSVAYIRDAHNVVTAARAELEKEAAALVQKERDLNFVARQHSERGQNPEEGLMFIAMSEASKRAADLKEKLEHCEAELSAACARVVELDERCTKLERRLATAVLEGQIPVMPPGESVMSCNLILNSI